MSSRTPRTPCTPCTPRTPGPSWLLLLYPRWWRARYGEEYAALLDDLHDTGGSGWRHVLDTAGGALDARIQGPPARATTPRRAATRLGAVTGLAVAAVLSPVIVLTNVVFSSPDDNDGPQVAAAYITIMAALALAGHRAGTRLPWRHAPAVTGATAGAVTALLTTAAYFAVDNLFLGVVAQQQSKIDGLAQTHLSSMRVYVNASLVLVGVLLTAMLTTFGAAIAALAGRVARHRRRPPRGARA
jgi:hypothetical protein